jgi:hypothetical protein
MSGDHDKYTAMTPVQIDEATLQDAAALGGSIVGTQFKVRLPIEVFLFVPYKDEGQRGWKRVSDGIKKCMHTFTTIGVIHKRTLKEDMRTDIYRLLGSCSGQNGTWGDKRWFWLANNPEIDRCYYVHPDSEGAAVKGLHAKIKRDVKKRLLGLGVKDHGL